MVESHHSEFKYDARIRWIKYCLIREATARPLFSCCGKTQQSRIYTLNAYSDTTHMFMMWGSNILCSFTNRGELCTNFSRRIDQIRKGQCFLPNGVWMPLPPSLKYLGLILQPGRHDRYFIRHGESRCPIAHFICLSQFIFHPVPSSQEAQSLHAIDDNYEKRDRSEGTIWHNQQ